MKITLNNKIRKEFGMSSCNIISISTSYKKREKKRNYFTKAFCNILAWKIANLLEICNTTGKRPIPKRNAAIKMGIRPPIGMWAISQSIQSTGNKLWVYCTANTIGIAIRAPDSDKRNVIIENTNVPYGRAKNIE